MKFSCERKKFKDVCAMVEKAIPKQSSLPVLQNLYLSLNQGSLIVRGNDLEMGIENHITVKQSETDGAILVKAKTLNEIISKVQSDHLELSVNEKNSLNIKTEGIEFNLLGENIAEYPAFPNVESGQKLTLKVSELLDLIKFTIFSVSYDDTKKFFNGVLIECKDNSVSFISTDGYRLAVKTLHYNQDIAHISKIIPFKAINEVFRLLQSFDPNKTVEISFSETQISFTCEQFLLISRLIQGQFPDIDKVIPSEFEHKVKVSRRQLLSSCERASIIASASNDIIKFSYATNSITIVAQASALGDFKEVLEANSLEGAGELTITFNVKLILDYLRVMEDDDLVINFNNAVSPCKFDRPSDENYTYIVMPIRAREFNQS
ncbi:MAG: DNA polymerase III subunit beta [bacterium]